ncbi:hypothetical protein B0H13DRAFT_2102733, partial [Mycena leptocephala]
AWLCLRELALALALGRVRTRFFYAAGAGQRAWMTCACTTLILVRMRKLPLVRAAPRLIWVPEDQLVQVPVSSFRVTPVAVSIPA